jgi:hypothetical protein
MPDSIYDAAIISGGPAATVDGETEYEHQAACLIPRFYKKDCFFSQRSQF